MSRPRLVAAIGTCAVAALVLFVGLRHPSASPAEASPGAPEWSGLPASRPHTVFSQSPYMGVACGVANSIACDRVGLAVWLRRPAWAVTATIAGAPLKLDWHGDGPPSSAPQRPRRAFDGYLQPAGIVAHLHVTPESDGRRWYGDAAPSPVVRFRINYGHGDVVVTGERVRLAAGWG